MRPSRHQTFMEVAYVMSKRATCQRLSVGAVITHKHRIVSCGWNGAPPGEPHCSGNDCPGKFGCQLTLHAEINAIRYIPSRRMTGLDLYITDSPCEECLRYIEVDNRVSRIFFSTPYRLSDHLKTSKLQVYRITPSGYITDWKTGDAPELKNGEINIPLPWESNQND